MCDIPIRLRAAHQAYSCRHVKLIPIANNNQGHCTIVARAAAILPCFSRLCPHFLDVTGIWWADIRRELPVRSSLQRPDDGDSSYRGVCTCSPLENCQARSMRFEPKPFLRLGAGRKYTRPLPTNAARSRSLIMSQIGQQKKQRSNHP